MDSFWEKKKNETRSALSFFDEFFKNLIILQNQNEERKRSLLRVFSFIQDPLGFWSAISEAHFKKRREKSEPPLNSRYYGRFIVRRSCNPNANYRLAASVHGALNQLEPRWHRKEPLRPGY